MTSGSVISVSLPFITGELTALTRPFFKPVFIFVYSSLFIWLWPSLVFVEVCVVPGRSTITLSWWELDAWSFASSVLRDPDVWQTGQCWPLTSVLSDWRDVTPEWEWDTAAVCRAAVQRVVSKLVATAVTPGAKGGQKNSQIANSSVRSREGSLRRCSNCSEDAEVSTLNTRCVILVQGEEGGNSLLLFLEAVQHSFYSWLHPVSQGSRKYWKKTKLGHLIPDRIRLMQYIFSKVL